MWAGAIPEGNKRKSAAVFWLSFPSVAGGFWKNSAPILRDLEVPTEMSCIPASHSMNNILTQVEPQLEESPGERRGSRAYQIFPEVNDDEDSCPDNVLYRRERLPSIVVEPTEQLEGGSPRWPKLCSPGSSLEEGEETGEDPTREASSTEPDSGGRKSSITPSQSQMSLSHLTPPTSPTAPEAAPPCLRS